MKNYNHKAIEKKWQGEWKKKKAYETKDTSDKPKKYILDMFPYPSGEGLHVGHPKGYIATDIYSRMKRMEGFNVLHPMGFDAFGLPAENYAIKHKVHPEKATAKNVARYKEQLKAIGLDYDWSREVNTTDPKYYKWTQWIFLKLLEKGLAYESWEPINWCPSCQTGLANEDLEDGKCERCGSVVEKKPMRQWVLRITDYAERLLADLDALDWPESIKESQRNWIGKSEGMLFTAPVKDTNLSIQTFSAHFEAFAADTFVVIAPDHSFLKTLVAGTPKEKEVLAFADALVKKRAKQGFVEEKESEGIFTGRYIVDPVGNGDLPIWVASYALADYGTGIVKCSAHDTRDFAFAKKYNIPLKPVLFPTDTATKEKVARVEECFIDMKKGVLSEPKEFAGKIAGEERQNIIAYLEKKGIATRKTTYKLRDWVFSRQRYWGEPIPLVHTPDGKVIPLSEKELPLTLPKVKSYAPTGTGESPLADIKKWVETTVKIDGEKIKVKRETNTMPQWAGSSWYYLRYMDPKNSKALVDFEKQKYWGQVDMYVGGTEHATRHLIYARFWHKFLYDIGVVSTTEPFKSLKNQGLIMGEDGRKMSKRWGNVVNPDDVIATYGADTLRLYEMFMGPFEASASWSTNSMIGSRRFLERVWRLSEKVSKKEGAVNRAVAGAIHKCLKKVTEDINEFRFNTAISAMMIALNAIENETEISRELFHTFLKMLSPFAPHMAEELWKETQGKGLIILADWPKVNEAFLVDDTMKLGVQVNGKVRAQFEVAADLGEEEIKKQALALPETVRWMEGKPAKKVIYVKGRIVSIVV